MKYTLILDTATKNIFVSVLQGDTVIESALERGEKNHASRVIVLIQELFDKHSLTIDDFDRLIVGIGPGSYTGVRVGLTVMKTFAYTKSIPLYTISTLYLMSSGYDEDRISAIDARRGNVFSSAYSSNDQELLKEDFRTLEETCELMKDKKLVLEDDYKVNEKKVLHHIQFVENVHDLVPNYLRNTVVNTK